MRAYKFLYIYVVVLFNFYFICIYLALFKLH